MDFGKSETAQNALQGSTATSSAHASALTKQATPIPWIESAKIPQPLSRWGTRAFLIAFAAFWLVVMASSWADAAENTPSENGDEYSFKWLDPEKKIYVLQNRKFAKAKRLQLSVLGGLGLSNPYRSSVSLDPRVTYYFSEDWGLEIVYNKVFNAENNTYRGLIGTGTPTIPVVREIQSQFGATLHWVPWYAKINMFNKILYFDWHFALGAGSMQAVSREGNPTTPTLTNEELFAIFAGTGHQYHISQSLVFRLDFLGTFYQARVRTGGEQSWYSDFNFGIGLGYRL